MLFHLSPVIKGVLTVSEYNLICKSCHKQQKADIMVLLDDGWTWGELEITINGKDYGYRIEHCGDCEDKVISGLSDFIKSVKNPVQSIARRGDSLE